MTIPSNSSTASTSLPGNTWRYPRGMDLAAQQIADAYFMRGIRSTSPRAIAEQRRLLEMFAESLKGRALFDCLPDDLSVFVWSHPEWKSGWTRRRVIASILRPFNWAARQRLIDKNPFRGLEMPAEGEPGAEMTDEQFRAVLRASDAPFRQALLFLRLSGCRPGEMRALQWQQIDLANGLAVLTAHKTAKTRRDRRPRVIVLHPVLVRLLEWLHASSGPINSHGMHVFVNAKGTPWTRYAFNTRFKRVRKRAGIPKECRPYGLRHAFGTNAIRKKVPIKVLSELMGHTSVRTTERYIHLAGDTELLHEAVRQIHGGK